MPADHLIALDPMIAAGHIRRLRDEVVALQERIDDLLAPPEGVDVKEVLGLYELVTDPSYDYQLPDGRVRQVLDSVPALAREVARLRAELARAADGAMESVRRVEEERDAARAEVEELRRVIAAEQGLAEGVRQMLRDLLTRWGKARADGRSITVSAAWTHVMPILAKANEGCASDKDQS